MQRLQQMAEAAMLPYGPADLPGGGVLVVETFGELELEYAAIRRQCVLMDLPQRGVIEVTGPERLDFLNRMLTQELKKMPPFHAKRSFWLNKKGRIDADLRVIDLPSRTLLEMDIHAVERTRKGLSDYIVMEDVSIADVTEKTHRMSLHGPMAMALLSAVSMNVGGAEASGPAFDDLQPGRAGAVSVAGATVVAWREDTCGVPGLELIVPSEQALAVYQLLIEAGHDRDHEAHEPAALVQANPWRMVASKVRLRPAGWAAYNIARIEAGTPMYNIDFGPESLPAETGVMEDRVSLTKGCYLGQEIVARMHSRGHPKQVLVGVKFQSRTDEATGFPAQPVSGAELFATGSDTPIGAVTSSTLSPMLGQTPVALAQVRWGNQAAGTVLQAGGEKARLDGTVQGSLVFVGQK